MKRRRVADAYWQGYLLGVKKKDIVTKASLEREIEELLPTFH